MKVPRVDADGNELGGVPVVLRDAPLGTYLGWNVTAGGFHKGKICNYAGGMIPFAKTRAERMANGDPRLSLEERYTRPRRLRRGGEDGSREGGERRVPAAERCRRAHRGSREEQCVEVAGSSIAGAGFSRPTRRAG